MDANACFERFIISSGSPSVSEIDQSTMVELALRFAIWLPISTYEAAPWLAPFAVRRSRIRTEPNAPGQKRDLWGLPTDLGYFADDNSLIKATALKKSLLPTTNPYGDTKITSGLVCCHIWSGTTHLPLLFSFVPNLVWLPKSLANYSDAHSAREPHPIHHALKQVSRARYRLGHLNPRVSKAWALLDLPNPVILPPHVSTEISDGEAIASLAKQRINRMIKFLEATLDPNIKTPNRFSKRYHAGVGPGIDNSVWTAQRWLDRKTRVNLLKEMYECL